MRGTNAMLPIKPKTSMFHTRRQIKNKNFLQAVQKEIFDSNVYHEKFLYGQRHSQTA